MCPAIIKRECEEIYILNNGFLFSAKPGATHRIVYGLKWSPGECGGGAVLALACFFLHSGWDTSQVSGIRTTENGEAVWPWAWAAFENVIKSRGASVVARLLDCWTAALPRRAWLA
jgi:hypothetical protein